MSRSERFFKEHHERLIKSQQEYSSATKQFSSNMNDADLKNAFDALTATEFGSPESMLRDLFPKPIKDKPDELFYILSSRIRSIVLEGDINQVIDDEGNTALTYVSYFINNNHQAYILFQKILAKETVDLHKANNDGYTALMICSALGLKRCFYDIMSHPSCDQHLLHMYDKKGKSAIYHAIDQDRTDVVNAILVDARFNVNFADQDGYTVIMYAAKAEKDPFIHAILDLYVQDIDLNHKGTSGNTLAMLINPIRWPKTARRLRDMGHEVSGFTTGQEDFYQLVMQGCYEKLNVPQSLRRAPRKQETFINALLDGQYDNEQEVIDTIRQHDLNPNVKNEKGISALLVACDRGYDAVVAGLLQCDADGSVSGKHGISPLMRATHAGHDAIVAMLLDKQPEWVHQTDNFGNTALHWLSKQSVQNMNEQSDQYISIYQSLCDAGIDQNAKNKTGFSAMDEVQRGGKENALLRILTDANKTASNAF